MDVITLSSGEEDNTSSVDAHISDIDIKPDVRVHNERKVHSEKKVPDIMEKMKKTLFEKFLESCKSNLRKEDVSAIIKKVKKIHEHAAKVYTDSVEFKLLLKRKLGDISKDPQNVYVHLKEVADELKLRKVKKIAAVRIQNGNSVSNGHVSSDAGTSAENHELSEVERRHIKKLTKVMRLLHNKIQVLEAKEVDFDDENDSSYMKLQRYRERFCKVREKLSEYLPEMNLRKQRVSFPVNAYPELYRRLESMVNKTRQFPDYHDVLKTVIECKLSSVADENQSIARQAFEVIGNELQKRRQYEDWASVSSYLKNERDPALDNPDLEQKLKSNEEEAKTKITTIINEYVQRETESKLEPKEVNEEEAELSAGEGSGQEEEEEIKNVEEDVDEDDVPNEDTRVEDGTDIIASAPEDDSEENDDVLVEDNEEPYTHTVVCASPPLVDPRLLQPVSPPVWEEYFQPSPPREDDEVEAVQVTESVPDVVLRKKRTLSLVPVNSSSPKKNKTDNDVSASSGMVKNTIVDEDTPTTILLD